MAQQLDDDELRIVIQRLSRRIRINRGDETLGDSQMGVLFRLGNDGPSSPSRLAEVERVSPPSMNRTLNGLEERGLVRRSPAEVDARKVTVTLTDEGSALIRETRRLRTAWFSRRLAELTPDERAALRDVVPLLQKLADS